MTETLPTITNQPDERLLTINELKAICQKQLDIGGTYVTLKESGKWGKNNYRIIFGVKGQIVQDNFGDGLIVMYPAKELLDALQNLA